jgi:hypothetical protein
MKGGREKEGEMERKWRNRKDKIENKSEKIRSEWGKNKGYKVSEEQCCGSGSVLCISDPDPTQVKQVAYVNIWKKKFKIIDTDKI